MRSVMRTCAWYALGLFDGVGLLNCWRVGARDWPYKIKDPECNVPKWVPVGCVPVPLARPFHWNLKSLA